MRRFEGKTIVVTGASRGLGRGFALAFAAEGASIIAAYHRRAQDAAETVRLVEELGGSAEAIAFDVADSASVDAAFAQLGGASRRVDVLVNNAGCMRDEAFALMDSARWREVLSVNLDGAFHCSRAVLPSMLRARGGCIVNVASVSAGRASPGQANYAASKGGLLALTRTLAAELAPKGIRVNALVPGMVDVGMSRHLDRRVAERYRRAIPIERVGETGEIANAALFLASDEASYVVGHALVVDGGLSL